MSLDYSLQIKLKDGNTVVGDGTEVPKSAVHEMPRISWTFQGTSTDVQESESFTLAMVDPGSYLQYSASVS